jgi:hypothetical protein
LITFYSGTHYYPSNEFIQNDIIYLQHTVEPKPALVRDLLVKIVNVIVLVNGNPIKLCDDTDGGTGGTGGTGDGGTGENGKHSLDSRDLKFK